MSMGPLGGILGSAAGTPLSQTKGATTERAARDSAVKETADQLDLHAEKSAGIGTTEGDSETSDRDADGRRAWEWNERKKLTEEESPDESATDPESEGHLDLFA
jgi:YD repeat-containing protein